MRRIVYLALSTTLIVVAAGSSIAQRYDTREMRERMRERQAVIEDPRSNPFKIEPYDPLKPGEPLPSNIVRSNIELEIVDATGGDTITVVNTAKQRLTIRLQGIDAPEIGQRYAEAAHKQLAELVRGKTALIEFDPKGKPDREGRVIAKVYVSGRDIGLSQIQAGLAWYCKDYKKAQTDTDRSIYVDAESEARANKVGLWSESSPRAPWDYRREIASKP